MAGRRCLDAGASTGGFTDVLLRAGAAEVIAVDVGYGQLAWPLRTDERVTVLDRTNVRHLTAEDIGGPVDLVVADLSFISLRLVLPALIACVRPAGDLLPMVKPQFEVGKERLGSGGVVRDPATARRGRARRGARRGGPRLAHRGGRAEPVARPVRERGILPMGEHPALGRARRRRGRAHRVRGRNDTGRRCDVRSVLLVAHTSRHPIAALAVELTAQLAAAGFSVRMLADEAFACGTEGITVVEARTAAEGAEIVIALGGDGTFLRATELARPAGTPMLGVNLGHVGFLAQAEPDDLADTVRAVADSAYAVEERVTVDAEVLVGGEAVATAWALNEVSLERTNRERMLEIAVAVDQRPLLRFGCDGVLCATPTGSTAYAFSAGGPIVWPNVDALVVVPNAAHALFTRPIVVAPSSVVDIDLISHGLSAVLSCDGRRSLDVPSGSAGARAAWRAAGAAGTDRVGQFRRPARPQVQAAGPQFPGAVRRTFRRSAR